MKISRFMSRTAFVAGLITAVAAPASAQVGGVIKKVRAKVAQTVAGPDTASASRVPPGAKAAPGSEYNDHVLEMTPAVLDQLEKALAVQAAARADNDRQIGKVLSPDEYDQCKLQAIRTPAGQKLSQEMATLMDGTKTQQQMSQGMQDIAKRLDALTEAECGLEANKARQLRFSLDSRAAAAAQAASGLSDIQLSILKERILPLCTATAAAQNGPVRIPTEANNIFYVYSPVEVQALQPRCSKLVAALRSTE